MRQLMFVLILAMGAPASASDLVRRITVVGHGSVEVVPDMAAVSLGVISEAKTGAAAMVQNSKTLAAVMAQLTAAGIEARDVQTSNLSLSPRWGKRSSNISGDNSISGFVASNTVTVRLRDIGALGKVLDAVLHGGANTFNGLSFGLQDPQPLQDAARKVAAADALRKARIYAASMGAKLGEVVTITEPTQNGVQPVMMSGAGDLARSRGVPVSQGEVSVAASVTMVFALTN